MEQDYTIIAHDAVPLLGPKVAREWYRLRNMMVLQYPYLPPGSLDDKPARVYQVRVVGPSGVVPDPMGQRGYTVLPSGVVARMDARWRNKLGRVMAVYQERVPGLPLGHRYVVRLWQISGGRWVAVEHDPFVRQLVGGAKL